MRGWVTGAAGRAGPILPVLVPLACAAAIAWLRLGSVAAPDWLPYALLVAAALAVLLLSSAAVAPPRGAVLALASLLALAAFAAASHAWSPLPAAARDEGLLTLLYALALALPLLGLRDAVDRGRALATVAVVLTALAVAAAGEVALAAEPDRLFRFGRLNFPISYVNGQAALLVLGTWPALAVASSRTAPVVLRAAALGGAATMLAGWAATQSKGGALALIASTVVVFALWPARLRLLLPALVAALPAALLFRALTGPFRADEAGFDAAVAGSGRAMLLAGAAGAVGGAVLAAADRRVAPSPRAHRALGAATLVLVVLALAGGTAALARAVDDPRAAVAERWRQFKQDERVDAELHLLEFGSNRYDFWRVSLLVFRDHPVAGAGARAFGPEYDLRGRSAETTTRAHSLPFDTLAELGLVGALLLAIPLALLLAAAVRRAWAREPAGLAALGAGAAWAAHASVDWIWTIPAATLPLVALLGIAASGDDPPPLARPAAAAGAGAALLLAAVAFAPPWLSARLTERALAEPAAPERDLRWARRLDPLAVEPLLAEARLAGSPEAAIPVLERLVEERPRWLASHFRLGLAYAAAGREEEARRSLLRARELGPRDAYVARALERLDG